MTAPSNAAKSVDTTAGPSALGEFISVTNTVIVMLDVLAEAMRASESGTAEIVVALTESFAGQTLDAIARWPA